MQILITGGAGFIGSHTADRLLLLGHQVRILDSLRLPIHLKGFPSYLDKTRVEFIYGDVRDRQVMEYAMKGCDVVYHLAAYQDYLPDYSTFTHINAFSTSMIFEIIESLGLPVKKVITASSQAVMGEGRYRCETHGLFYPGLRTDEQLRRGMWEHVCPQCGTPARMELSDETVIHPQNPYGMSKYMQEMLTVNLGRRIGVPSVAMRYSIVQGARQSLYNAYSGACRIFSLCAFFDKPMPVYEDGRSVRDFVNIHDVVDANVLVMERPEADYGVFNVGGDKGLTVSEFAAAVNQGFGKEVPVQINGEYRFGDTRHIFSDTSRLRALGWSPKREVSDSIREYKQFLEQQMDLEDILDYAGEKMRSLGVIRKANV